MATISSLLLRLLLLTCWHRVFAADKEEMAYAGVDPNAQATYFVNSGFVFALNVVENGDVYYHMHVSSAHSWMGIGFGDRMAGTRMIVVHLAANGRNLTTSCRMAYGHSEPVHDPDCIVEDVSTDHYAPFHNTISPDGVFIAHSVCRKCWNNQDGPLSMTLEEQPFIYALGPNATLLSDDLNAPLRLHEFYGSFTMNMTKAVNYTGTYGRVPAPQDPALAVGHAFWSFGNYYSSTPFNTATLADWSPTAHAVFMCLAFLLIFPLGAISLRITRRARFHAGAQFIGLGFVMFGLGFGAYASTLYNKSKHFTSVHQVIGLLVVAALFLQVGLGMSHHFVFLRSGSPTTMGKIHRYLGVSVLVLAVVNGGLGFNFAQNSPTAYIVVAAIMGSIMMVLISWISVHNRRHVYKPEKDQFASDYGAEPPAEYEMHDAPFARMGYVPTPTRSNFHDDPENYQDYLTRQNTQRNMGQESLYTDTPESDIKNPFRTKWEAIEVK